jgi:hypothetical protein
LTPLGISDVVDSLKFHEPSAALCAMRIPCPGECLKRGASDPNGMMRALAATLVAALVRFL